MDFSGPVGMLAFPPGARLASIRVPIVDDDSPEETESFTVILQPGDDFSLSTQQATVTIQDNDGRWSSILSCLALAHPSPSAVAVIVQFSRPSYTVNELAGTVDVAVQITSASEIVTVNFSTGDGTALGKQWLR